MKALTIILLCAGLHESLVRCDDGNQTVIATPKRRVNINSLQQRQSDYLSNYNSIIRMAGDLKHSDSSGCESMRRFNNYYTRQFIDRLLNQHNRNMATITNSRLSVDVQIQTKKKLTEAFDVANKHFTKLATHHAHDLNKNCTLTNAMSVVDHCNSNIGALSMRQLDAASQLVAMPMQFDRDLQSAYAKAEPYVLQF